MDNQRFVRFILTVLIILFYLIPPAGSAQSARVELVPDKKPVSHLPDPGDYMVYFPIVHQSPLEPNVFGIEMEGDWNDRLLDLAEQGGVNWVRRNGVLWQTIETTEGVRDWSGMAALASEMITLNQRGMELILIVRGVPDWAMTNDGNICGPIAQSKFTAFASFMSELVSRYSKPPYNVRYWEIGNEPDFPFSDREIPFGCWGNEEDPYYGGGYYGEMLKVIYPEIKAADPDAQVLVGGLLLDCDPRNPPAGKNCTSSKFLEGILRSGAGWAFDGVSYHSYDYYSGTVGNYSNPNWSGSSSSTGPILGIKADYLRGLLQQYGSGDKYLMNTENALLCNHFHSDANFELTKAVYAAQGYAESVAHQVPSAIWYSFTSSWQSTQLVLGSSTPLPAYYALQAASELLRGMVFTQQIPASGVTIYEFSGRGDHKWVLWSADGQTHTVELPRLPAQQWDLLGNPQSLDQILSIGVQPVYLEW